MSVCVVCGMPCFPGELGRGDNICDDCWNEEEEAWECDDEDEE